MNRFYFEEPKEINFSLIAAKERSTIKFQDSGQTFLRFEKIIITSRFFQASNIVELVDYLVGRANLCRKS